MSGVRAWIPPLLWAILIFALSSMPDLTPDVDLFKHSDKIAHVVLYTPLGFLLMRAALRQPGRLQRQPMIWTLVIGMLYGLSDEIHQAFVPGRTMDMLDWLADGVGVAAGAFLQLRLEEKRRKTLRSGDGAA